jgi:hypothetical protein
MSKRRRNPEQSDAAAADRAARYRAIVAELAAQSGLPKTDLKLVAAAWTMLAQDGVRQQILAGEIVDISDLERCAAILHDIMPSKPHELTVNFIKTAWCPNCRSAFTPPAEPAPTDRAQQSVPPRLLPAPQVAQNKPAAAPLADDRQDTPAKPAPAPKRSDTDYAPWRDISGSGRVQGQEPVMAATRSP